MERRLAAGASRFLLTSIKYDWKIIVAVLLQKYQNQPNIINQIMWEAINNIKLWLVKYMINNNYININEEIMGPPDIKIHYSEESRLINWAIEKLSSQYSFRNAPNKERIVETSQLISFLLDHKDLETTSAYPAFDEYFGEHKRLDKLK